MPKFNGVHTVAFPFVPNTPVPLLSELILTDAFFAQHGPKEIYQFSLLTE